MRALFLRAALVAFLSSLPAAALAAAPPTDFKSLANLVVDIIRTATIVVVGLGVVYYLWGIATSILKSGEGGAKSWEAFRSHVLWGVLILFVMVSIWQILRVLSNTLFP